MNKATIRIAIQSALVALAAYMAGSHFTDLLHAETSRIGAVWSLVTGIVVLQATPHETFKSGVLRLVGTLIGAIIGACYLSMFSFSLPGMAISVGVTVLLCQIAGVPDNGRLAAITVVIVLAVSAAMPTLSPVANAALRFGESFIGAVIAMTTVLLWPKAGDAA